MSYTGWYDFGDFIRKSRWSCRLYRRHFLSCGKDLECVYMGGQAGDITGLWIIGWWKWVGREWVSGGDQSDYALGQCFSTFGRPRPGKFFFHKTRARSQQIYSSVPFQIFLSSYIKLILVLIINYGIIIKSISTLMYTVWHVDKYKITFKLVINHWTNEIL